MAEDGGQLKGWYDPFPQGPDNRPSPSGAAWGLAGDGALGPAEADLVEIQVSVVGADVMEHTGNGTADAVVEALSRVRTPPGITAPLESPIPQGSCGYEAD